VGLETDQRIEGGTVTVTVSGELDLFVGDQFGAALEAAEMTGAPLLQVDISGVPFLDSTCLGLLVGSAKRLNAGDRKIAITGAQPGVMKIFTMMGLTPVLDVRPAGESCG